ncbi:hypothetical protein EJO69_02180 [Flaviflexus salsibiostraticola]|uniref:Uncharacterized protein n=1 Tax=Flaviflexus salsibiostraticola TaxID=1282737 RepID=A0A3Q8WSI0_9ACTO|nr:hypothetical protein EJO69_02180 [Flaviflexus salsibiostraticola]
MVVVSVATELSAVLLQIMINAPLSGDADADVDAEWDNSSPNHLAQRHGYLAQSDGFRHRPLDTWVYTVDVAIPKLKTGTFARANHGVVRAGGRSWGIVLVKAGRPA